MHEKSRTEKRIVNFIGWPGSGKSAICGHLGTKGYELHRPSDAIRQYAAERHLVLRSRADYQACHEAMIATNPDAMIQSVLDSDAKRICVDGLRAPAAMRRLKTFYGNTGALVIALDCPFEERLRRATHDQSRHGHRRQITPEAFLADEQPDLHNDDPQMVSMDDMFAMADYTIDASRPLTEVIHQVDVILQEHWA